MSKRKTIYVMCKACSGTGKSRWFEYRDCDVCDGRGTITSYVELSDPVVRDPQSWAAVVKAGAKYRVPEL